MDPVDPDPEHCFKVIQLVVDNIHISVLCQRSLAAVLLAQLKVRTRIRNKSLRMHNSGR